MLPRPIPTLGIAEPGRQRRIIVNSVHPTGTYRCADILRTKESIGRKDKPKKIRDEKSYTFPKTYIGPSGAVLPPGFSSVIAKACAPRMLFMVNIDSLPGVNTPASTGLPSTIAQS